MSDTEHPGRVPMRGAEASGTAESPPIPPSEPRALTFNDLRDANRTRCEGAFHPIAAWSPNDWMTAVAGEVGEAANMLKKLHRADPDYVFDLADFGRELADVVIYLDLLAERMGVDLGAAVIGKFNEVSQRRGSSIRLDARAALAARSGEGGPRIVCFCGSSRFVNEMAVLMWEYEKAGRIAMGLHLLPDNAARRADGSLIEHHLAEEQGVAEQMDALHLRKIDLADEVFVVNIGGYIGDSTRNEIAYATSLGKPLVYLEALDAADRKEPQP